MPQDKFVIGIDFGTESGRVVVVRVRDGEEMAAVVIPYPDGVFDEKLPGGPRLEPDSALQNPHDYHLVLETGVPKALKEASVKAEDVIAVGTDFTSCTVFATRQDGTPLCFLPKYRREPLAWAILWKHHSAQPEADRITEIGRERNEEFIRIYGGKYSSEWFFAKVLQVLNDSPEIYEAAGRFIEGTDWIVWQLTGQEKRNNSTAGYKAMWVKGVGFPSHDFFRAVHPRLENVIREKVGTEFHPLGTRAGGLTAYWACQMGLREGTPVSMGVADGHVTIPATTVTKPGSLSMVMGTSLVQMLMGTERRIVEGICGVVEDGIVPGFWGYEAGQYAGGDMFAWFFDHGVAASVKSRARKLNLPFTALLEKQAAALRPGESGLLALDWWNGNRCVLVDADLTGLLLGATLATPSEAIFRALIEATAFGTRQIVEAFEAKGLHTKDVVACGGLPAKNKLLMQIFADVIGREIKVAKRPQTCSALGAAIHAAAAAGREAGGYKTISEAAEHMAHLQGLTYRPRAANHEIYDRLFKEFQTLHDYFGRGENDVMKRLKCLRREQAAQ
jgi:L-ribulokinase